MGPTDSAGRIFDKATLSFLGSPTSALYLTLLRIVVSFWCLVAGIGNNAPGLAELNHQLLIPTTFYKLLPFFPEASATSFLLILFKIALAFVMLGLATRISALICFFVGSYLMAFSYNFGYSAHNLNLLPLIFLVLAIAPSADFLSVSGIFRQRRIRSLLSYSLPIHFLRIVLIFVYFSAAIQKLRESGLDFFMSEHLAIKMAQSSLALSVWLSDFSLLVKVLAAAGLVIQLLSPLCLWWKTRRFIVLLVIFQVGTSIIGAHFPLNSLLLIVLWFPFRKVMRFTPIFNETNPKALFEMKSSYLYGFIVLAFIGCSILRFEAWPLSHFPMYSDTSYIQNGLVRYRLRVHLKDGQEFFYHKSDRYLGQFPQRRIHAYFRMLEKTNGAQNALELIYWDILKNEKDLAMLELCRQEWLPVTPQSVREEAPCQVVSTYPWPEP